MVVKPQKKRLLSWKADILVIHAGFLPIISVCDRERKMDLNVTLSTNLPDHDSHCLSVLDSRQAKATAAVPYLWSVQRSAKFNGFQGRKRITITDSLRGDLHPSRFCAFNGTNCKRNERKMFNIPRKKSLLRVPNWTIPKPRTSVVIVAMPVSLSVLARHIIQNASDLGFYSSAGKKLIKCFSLSPFGTFVDIILFDKRCCMCIKITPAYYF